MQDSFIAKKVFIKIEGKLQAISIEISKPIEIKKPDSPCKFSCSVIFEDIEKYNYYDVRGVDEIHTVECAIIYLNGIRRNSNDPEFFDEDGESMLFIDGQI